MSKIIDESAAGTAAVNDVVGELVQNLENLNRVSETLDRNMGELKSEIAAFKTE